jgi:O-antigen/teichoic acid export membrane protein
MQWRMAISAGSSYFIFQLFNPILFQYHGAVVAGQMGMTLTAANALAAGSMTVLQAKVPEFGKLIAVRDWKSLDGLFYNTTKKALTLVLIGATVGALVIWFLQRYYLPFGKRFIPAAQALLLFGTVFFQGISGSLASYLRAHKQEPLMRMTVFASLLQGGATWYLGKHYSSLGATAGYFAVTAFFICPYCLVVWKRCRNRWHTS